MSERASVSYRLVFRALLVSLGLSMAFGAFVYVRYIRFEPRAALHVRPGEGAVFVRLDVEQAVVYEPFRRHLLSLLEAGRVGKESRLLHLERKTSLELGVDAREIAVGFSAEDCAVAVGGLFRRDRVVPGVRAMLEEEGFPAELGANPAHVLGPRGRAFTVTEDGVLILASAVPVLRSAVPARGAFTRGEREVLGIATGPALDSVEVDGARLHRLTGLVQVGTEPGAAFVWSVDLEGEGPWDAPRFGQLLERAGTNPNDFGEIDWRTVAPGRFRAEGRLSRERLDRLVARLGGAIAACLELP